MHIEQGIFLFDQTNKRQMFLSFIAFIMVTENRMNSYSSYKTVHNHSLAGFASIK